MTTNNFFRKDGTAPSNPPDLKAFIIENRLRRKVRAALENTRLRRLEKTLFTRTDVLLQQAENEFNRMNREGLLLAESVMDRDGIEALIYHLRSLPYQGEEE